MANQILGIELDQYKARIAIAEASLRSVNPTGYIEVPIEAGEADYYERSAKAIGQALTANGLQQAQLFLSLPDNRVYSHVFEFGFPSMKKAQLDQVVGSELEGVLPIDLEDMAYTYEVLPKAAGEEGMKVLAAGWNLHDGQKLLAAFEEFAVEPKGIFPAVGAYPALAGKLSSFQNEEGAIALLDIGPDSSTVVVMQGSKPLFERGLSRGLDDVASALARAGNLGVEQARELLAKNGFVGSKGKPVPNETLQTMSDVIAKSLEPLVRDLRRTVQSAVVQLGDSVKTAVLVGDGAAVGGMSEFLTEHMQLPVHLVDTTDVIKEESAGRGGFLPWATVFAGSNSRTPLNLRRGELSYSANISLMNPQIRRVAMLAFVVLLFFALAGWARHSKLRSQEDALQKRVALESIALYGEELDPKAVLGLEEGEEVEEGVKLPAMSAYDVVQLVHRRLPPKKDLTVNVRKMEVDKDKFLLEGRVKGGSKAVQTLGTALKGTTCSNEQVDKGTEKTIGSGEEVETEFSFTIDAKCLNPEAKKTATSEVNDEVK